MAGSTLVLIQKKNSHIHTQMTGRKKKGDDDDDNNNNNTSTPRLLTC
jgi:hypothetical protein